MQRRVVVGEQGDGIGEKRCVAVKICPSPWCLILSTELNHAAEQINKQTNVFQSFQNINVIFLFHVYTKYLLFIYFIYL